MRAWLLHALVFGLVLACGGVLVAASGIVPIEASSGHFAVTEWFLQFAKHRSVATHTLGAEFERTRDPALVLKGAGLYETGCRPCHGAASLPQPRVPRAMLPPPPFLPERVADWEPEELFYIVKHGIKFTGMPAWPAPERDDEVRAVVAFLLELPELDAGGYERLVQGEPAKGEGPPATGLEGAPPRAPVEGCVRCHGRDGMGRGAGVFPKLAGQRQAYLFGALRAYARDERRSGAMAPIAAALGEADMRGLAEHYASLAVDPSARVDLREADPGAIARGREIATRGLPEQRVPPCAECHGPAAERRNDAYPRLAGQHADYLALQLKLLRDRRRGGSSYVHLMHKVAPRLRPEQIRAVAAYYASLPWGQDDPAR